MANTKCFFSMQVETVTGKSLYRDALTKDYGCTLTINQFIEKVENEFNGKVVDITFGSDAYITDLDMDELNLDETLEELYNRFGKEEYYAFFITIRENKATNGPRMSISNIGKLKKAEKNAKAALKKEVNTGNSRAALTAADKVYWAAVKALRNAQEGGRSTRKQIKQRKTRKNRK